MVNIYQIKVVLVENGKTDKWLTKELCKTPYTISKWCSNSIPPEFIALNEIARLYDIRIK